MFRVRFFIILFLKLIKFDTFFYRLKFLKRRAIILIDNFAINNVKSKDGVLLIRLDAIGDFIVWLDSAKEYKANFPNQKITLIANYLWADLAQNLPFWDEVIAIDVNLFKSNLLYRFRTISKISKKGFLVAIHPNSSRSFLLGDSIIRASSSKIKIGFEGDLNNIYLFEKKLSDNWYTKLIENPTFGKSELYCNSHFVSKLFNKTINIGLPILPTIDIPDKIEIQNKYFIVSPGASWVGRQWSAENFSLAINNIALKYGLLPILCGSNNEKELCELIIGNSSISCLNLAGKTTLPQLAELIRGAIFVLANESSSVHIASAVNTVSFCITGGGHFGRFVPYSINSNEKLPIIINEDMDCYFCNWNCSKVYNPDGPVPCIKGIAVEKVLNEVFTYLN
jgi:ADP-heptose:LPS heptosyltransferase